MCPVSVALPAAVLPALCRCKQHVYLYGTEHILLAYNGRRHPTKKCEAGSFLDRDHFHDALINYGYALDGSASNPRLRIRAVTTAPHIPARGATGMRLTAIRQPPHMEA